MELFKLVRTVLKLIGASPSLTQYKIYRFYGLSIMFIMTVNLYAYILALIINLNNIAYFCETLSMSMGALSSVIKAFTLINSANIHRFLHTEIQDIVDSSEFSYRHSSALMMPFYHKYNPFFFKGRSIQHQKYMKIESKYSRLYGIFMFSSAQALSFGPLARVLIDSMKNIATFRYPCEVV